MKTWYLDFEEKNQMWHIDLERVAENQWWTNIGYGSYSAIDHFCNVVDMMKREFGLYFTTQQIIRLAECTPGITVHNPSPIPEDHIQQDKHTTPIYSKEKIEKHVDWDAIER
jgi:hypothetical protein